MINDVHRCRDPWTARSGEEHECGTAVNMIRESGKKLLKRKEEGMKEVKHLHVNQVSCTGTMQAASRVKHV
jgi:hypothetical protein